MAGHEASQGTAPRRRKTPIEDAYDHYRLERQGNLLSPRTLVSYDYHTGAFFEWLRREHPHVGRFADLTVDVMRAYRAQMTGRPSHRGGTLSAATLQDSHASLRVFLRWADSEGHKLDPRLLKLPRVRVPAKEPTVIHIGQFRQIPGACNAEFPQQDLAIRILVGSGVRIIELCGIAVEAWDGLPDLMLDSIELGRAELRVCWDGGAKGKKSRRVPITPRLAAAIKRYQARQRPEVEPRELLVNARGKPYDKSGIDTMLDRPQAGWASASTRMPSGTPSRRWPPRWAGTSSSCGPRWATPPTTCCRSTSGWPPAGPGSEEGPG